MRPRTKLPLTALLISSCWAVAILAGAIVFVGTSSIVHWETIEGWGHPSARASAS